MFGIGGAELVVVVIILLLFVGPDELPKVARTVGKGLTDLRRAANVAQAELQETMQELTREVDSLQRDVQDAGKDLLSVRNEVEQKLDQLHTEPVRTPTPAAAVDDEVTVIPRRRSAEPASAVPVDPWHAAHRPPEVPDEVARGADADPAVTAPDDSEPTAGRDESAEAANPLAMPAEASQGESPPTAPKPAFRMPGAPVAGTVSRGAGSVAASAAVAPPAAPPVPEATEPPAAPTAEDAEASHA